MLESALRFNGVKCLSTALDLGMCRIRITMLTDVYFFGKVRALFVGFPCFEGCKLFATKGAQIMKRIYRVKSVLGNLVFGTLLLCRGTFITIDNRDNFLRSKRYQHTLGGRLNIVGHRPRLVALRHGSQRACWEWSCRGNLKSPIRLVEWVLVIALKCLTWVDVLDI